MYFPCIFDSLLVKIGIFIGAMWYYFKLEVKVHVLTIEEN